MSNKEPQTSSPGSYGGVVVSQVLEFVALREMDGDAIECRAFNDFSGSDVAKHKVVLDILCKLHKHHTYLHS